VKADLTRIHGRYSLGLLLLTFLHVHHFRPVFTMRLCQAVSGLPAPLRVLLFFPCRVLHYFTQQWAAITLSWNSQIGPGFLINHGWGFVTGRGPKTGPGIIIGSNVTVFHGVTIGMKHKITASGRTIEFPVVEDDVWIGPHAIIAGNVVVGRGSRIAPGTVVTGNVEPYSIVGGNPMRVLKTNALPDVAHPAQLDDIEDVVPEAVH